jgi:hypothetical protein
LEEVFFLQVFIPNLVRIYLLPHVLHDRLIPWFDHHNDIWREVQILNLTDYTVFFSLLCISSLLGPNILLSPNSLLSKTFSL